jgi:hypothetical protein
MDFRKKMGGHEFKTVRAVLRPPTFARGIRHRQPWSTQGKGERKKIREESLKIKREPLTSMRHHEILARSPRCLP